MGPVLDFVDKLNIGDKVKVHFNAESREWESKWFTDNKAWKIEVTYKAPVQAQTEEPAAIPYNSESDVLPF
jgi:hypothetical protein